MAFYDRIAKQWHTETGYHGGALKRFVLNDLLIDAAGNIDGRAILELGAGNGYFLPLLMRRCSGQSPARVVITDQSQKQLEIATREFYVDGAEYTPLDVRRVFPFDAESFDLILATMVLNEIPKRGVLHAVAECRRVLRARGQLLITVVHPDFVSSLDRRGHLRRQRNKRLTMPGSSGLRLPVQKTSKRFYETTLEDAGFEVTARDVLPTQEVLNAKPALKRTGDLPLALILECVVV